MKKSQIARCKRIADRYGLTNQERQAVSELSELLQVLTRRPAQRGDKWEEEHGKTWRESLLDEIADTYIMLEQLLMLHNINKIEVDEEIDYKLERQLDRIKTEKEEKGT